MRFYLDPQGIVSKPTNYGFFYKITVFNGSYLAIEEIVNGTCEAPAFAGSTEKLSAEAIFDMCFFLTNSDRRKKHRAALIGAITWSLGHTRRIGTPVRLHLGSSFTEDGMLNVLGDSSGELLSKISEVITDLSVNDTVNHDLHIQVTVLCSVARDPVKPATLIEVQGGNANDAVPASEPPRKSQSRGGRNNDATALHNSNTSGRRGSVPSGKRAGTPQPDEDDD